jgi:hypothetical protein
MIDIHFARQRAEKIIASLAAGDPIPPPAEGWRVGDLLCLAGILAAHALLRPDARPAVDRQPCDSDHVEPNADRWTDLQNAFKQQLSIALRLIDGTFDDCFEDQVLVELTNTAKGVEFRPQGYKWAPDGLREYPI